MEIKIKSVGIAKNQEKKHFGNWRNVITKLVINKEYKDALDGLNEYSHLVVIYWMHEVKKCDIKHVPQGKTKEVPEVGIFACRCAERPNPIGISTAKIVSIDNNIITVKGLDIIDNTPILDIKPYTPQYDVAKDVKVPAWTNKLEY